jgi:hypothetical protein
VTVAVTGVGIDPNLLDLQRNLVKICRLDIHMFIIKTFIFVFASHGFK